MVRRVSLQPQGQSPACGARTPDRLARLAGAAGTAAAPAGHAGELARLAQGAGAPPAGDAAAADAGPSPPAAAAWTARRRIWPPSTAPLVVLALHAAGRPLSRIVPQTHATAAAAGAPSRCSAGMVFADAFPGLSGAGRRAAGASRCDRHHKEVIDSRDGSGFSFNDIAADRAGTRFARSRCRTGRLRAAALQDADAALKEADRPPVDGLPEFMPQAEFRARYGGIGAAPYRRMMAEIEQRVMSRPLLR